MYGSDGTSLRVGRNIESLPWKTQQERFQHALNSAFQNFDVERLQNSTFILYLALTHKNSRNVFVYFTYVAY